VPSVQPSSQQAATSSTIRDFPQRSQALRKRTRRRIDLSQAGRAYRERSCQRLPRNIGQGLDDVSAYFQFGAQAKWRTRTFTGIRMPRRHRETILGHNPDFSLADDAVHRGKAPSLEFRSVNRWHGSPHIDNSSEHGQLTGLREGPNKSLHLLPQWRGLRILKDWPWATATSKIGLKNY